MAPFAGYSMPIQYPTGVMGEHQHCRAQAGLFDVSHMGQVLVRAPDPRDAALALESLLPIDVLGLGLNRQRYGFFTHPEGGILDDLMVTNRGDHFFLVVNAACKAQDIALLTDHLSPQGVRVTPVTDRALLAVQGPAAGAVIAALDPRADAMRFMDVATLDLGGIEVWASRSGYTGEDGFELSVAEAEAEALFNALMADERLELVGLGARDSLRLEAGLCLYGHDIDTTTSPVEAGLTWAIQKVRRPGGARAGGFPGAERIFTELEQGPKRRRVGLRPEGRAPMREGVALFSSEDGGAALGRVTSGGFGPSVGHPVSMGYVAAAFAEEGQQLWGEVRGKRLPVSVQPLPFTPLNFKR
jgi:aminomethyltransferase